MAKLLIASVALSLLLVSSGTVSAAKPWPPMWPKPSNFTGGSTTLQVSRDLSLAVTCPGGSCSQSSLTLLNGVFARHVTDNVLGQHHAKKAGGGSDTELTSVSVVLGSTQAPPRPHLGMSENYTLTIVTTPTPRAVISCAEVFGCYHGLETLSQLIAFNFDSQTYRIHDAPWSIQDSPRFPHRGLLIDTSRHWLPLDYIRRVIDSVTYAKLNTIHWHLTDAQSWPFDSPSHPELSKKGAWSPQQRYTTSDIADMVEYAEVRGIRMMVEFDTPGHTAAMCKGAPEVCPSPLCPDSWVDNWALDITKNASYRVVNAVLKDLVQLFPENMIHLGGDEVDFTCWKQDTKILQWLTERNMTYADGYAYWVKRVQRMSWDLGKEVVGWEEIWNSFGTALNKSVIIQQWLPHSTSLPLNVTNHGYRLIWSDATRWYLDQMMSNWTNQYTADPCHGLPDSNCELVLGGEGCMWGETVDASDGLQTIWPRLGAIAERLWSPKATTRNLEEAEDRLFSFRCLLNDRGIPAAPVNNSHARRAPPQPGSCFQQ